MPGIQLVVELDDKGTPKLKQLDDVLEELGVQSQKTSNTWSRSFKSMGAAVAGVASRIKTMTTSLPAMLGAAGLAAGFGMVVKKGIEFNAQLESAETQLGVMVGSTERARNMMKELVAFAAKTPFALGETVSAAKMLEGAGIGGSEMLRRVGDAAAFAQKPITDIANTFSWLASGNFGEAFQNLRQWAIASRPMLEAEGLVFDKSGAYVGSVDQALGAVSRIIDRRFGGMMEAMGQTFEGKKSTLSDTVNAFFGNLTGPLFDRMKARMDNVIATFDKLANSQAVRNLGATIARGFDMAADALERLASNPDALARGLQRVLAIAMGVISGVIGLGPALVKGFRWTWNVASNFAVWLGAAWGDLMADMAVKLFNLGTKVRNFFLGVAQDIVGAIVAGASALPQPFSTAVTAMGAAVIGELEKMKGEVDTAGQATLESAAAMAQGLKDEMGGRLAEAVAGEGFWAEITRRVQAAVALTKAAMASAAPNPLSGPPTGPGLDGGTRTTTSTPTEDPEIARLMKLHEAWLDISNKRFAAEFAAKAKLDQLWADYWDNQDKLAMNWLSDSVTAAILEKGQSLKEQLDSIWQSMKASFIRNTVDMALAWIRSKVAMNKANSKFSKEEAAARAAYFAAQIVATKASGKASAADAAAKYHEATAWIPFAGPGIASAAVAKMMGDIAKASAAAVGFATGTARVPGVAGSGDSVRALLAPGEAVIPAARVLQYGPDLMESIRTGQWNPRGGGGDVFAPVVNVNGLGDDAGGMDRLIRRVLVPELERLHRQRRFKTA